MLDFLSRLFDTSDFPARWSCGRWTTGHGWLHILADLGVASAYVAIPLVLGFFILRRKDLPFSYMFWLFGAFILACGSTHLMEALAFWWPAYRLMGVLKLLTAVVSWVTLLGLVPLVPRALALRSPHALEAEIDERMKAETALRESERRFRLMLEGVKDYAIFMLDPQGRVASWNAGAERIEGYRADEIVGRHFSRFFPVEDVKKGKPDLELAVADREGRYEEEGWRIRKDGSQFWASVLISAARDESGRLVGFAKVTRDVTERRHREEALRQSEARFRLLIESVKDYAIFMLDPDGRIASWNAGAERIKGYKAEEIIGRHFSIFYPPEDLEQRKPERELRIAVAEGRYEEEGQRLRKDGSRFWADVLITAVRDASGTLKGFAKVTRDVSERKEAQNAAEGFARQLQRSNAELETFASVASHDLQEPLRKIQAFGDRLKSKCGDTLGEDGRDYLERMQNSAARMRTLINDLLAFSRLTTKAQPFAMVDLAQVAREVVIDLEDRIHQTGGRVDLGELPALEADPLQMRQLLQNLIGNGLKFHRPDEPPVVKVLSRRATEASSTIAQSIVEPRYEITVQDNGIGFEEQYLDRIFEVFQRLHGRAEYEGTGMGLAICRKIVERHRGNISARSSAGQGAAFIVTLPRRQAHEEPAP